MSAPAEWVAAAEEQAGLAVWRLWGGAIEVIGEVELHIGDEVLMLRLEGHGHDIEDAWQDAKRRIAGQTQSRWLDRGE